MKGNPFHRHGKLRGHPRPSLLRSLVFFSSVSRMLLFKRSLFRGRRRKIQRTTSGGERKTWMEKCVCGCQRMVPNERGKTKGRAVREARTRRKKKEEEKKKKKKKKKEQESKREERSNEQNVTAG